MPGSGSAKSHLLIALGTEAAMAGFRVRYVLATKLVNELVEADDDFDALTPLTRLDHRRPIPRTRSLLPQPAAV
ncbi:MAG TPA: ATP-binding protein [Actinoplanes sp.]